MPSSFNGGEDRFPNTYLSYWGFFSSFLSIFGILFFLRTFIHQVLRTRMLFLSYKYYYNIITILGLSVYSPALKTLLSLSSRLTSSQSPYLDFYSSAAFRRESLVLAD